MGQKCGLKTMLCVQSLRYYLQTLAHRPFGHLTIPPIQPLLMCVWYDPAGDRTPTSMLDEITIYFLFTGMQCDAMFKTGNFELSRSTKILEGW